MSFRASTHKRTLWRFAGVRCGTKSGLHSPQVALPKSAITGNRSAVRNRPRWDYRDFLAAMNAALSACFQCVGQPGLLVDLEQRPGLHGAGPVQALGEPGMDWGE